MNYEKVSIMNQKALKTLEYDKIIEQLASYASSPLGRKKCLELVPSSSLSQITRMQHETHDALTRLFKKGHISFGDAKDIRGALKRLEIGSSMNITELLQTAALLENTARVKAYGRRENADQTPDSLEDLFSISFWGICICLNPTIRYRRGVHFNISDPVIKQGSIRRV